MLEESYNNIGCDEEEEVDSDDDMEYTDRAPDKLRTCIFYAMKASKNSCIIRSECTHYAYILLCKQTFQIRSVLVRW